MQLVKEGKHTELIGTIDLLEVREVIAFMINYHQSTFLPIEEWLTKKERDFYIASVVIGNKGLKYTSQEASGIYREIFNLRRQSDIRGYLIRLEEKGWLVSHKDNKTLDLLEFFKFDINDLSVKIDIHLNYRTK